MPLTVSCFSKIQIGFAFLVPAHLGSPGKRAVKRVCVCVCVLYVLFEPSCPVDTVLLFTVFTVLYICFDKYNIIHSFIHSTVAGLRGLCENFRPDASKSLASFFFTRPHALPREEYIVFRPYTRTPSGRL